MLLNCSLLILKPIDCVILEMGTISIRIRYRRLRDAFHTILAVNPRWAMLSEWAWSVSVSRLNSGYSHSSKSLKSCRKTKNLWHQHRKASREIKQSNATFLLAFGSERSGDIWWVDRIGVVATPTVAMVKSPGGDISLVRRERYGSDISKAHHKSIFIRYICLSAWPSLPCLSHLVNAYTCCARL